MSERASKVRRLEEPDHLFQDRCLVCLQPFITTTDLKEMVTFLPKDLCFVIYSFLSSDCYPYCTKACSRRDTFNRCIECYSDLSDYNPRQYCGKRYCYQTWRFASHPEEVQRYFR